jgi:hypothetical protein
MKKLLIVVVLAAGFGWWFTHRGLSENTISRFYATQVEAFGQQDLKRLCDQYAPEFKGTERQIGAAGVQVQHPDKAAECKSLETMFELKKRFDAKQTSGDELGTELSLERTGLEIAADGKSADVRLNVHVNFGGAFIADGGGVDHLVLRNGKVLLAATESETHVSGILANGGPVSAAVSRLNGAGN